MNVNMKIRKIIFYKMESGKCPVDDYLDTLPDKTVEKVAWVLRIIRDFDVVPRTYFKKLLNTSDIWVVRVQVGNNIYSYLGYNDGVDLIILTNGFQKKSQKTPKKEIKLAEMRKRDYVNRRNNNG